MCSSTNIRLLMEYARATFDAAVRAVQPANMISRTIQLSTRNQSHIIGSSLSLSLNKNVYAVGFGKAVGGMAFELECLLGDHLQRGIVSVPVGLQSATGSHLPRPDGVFEVIKGAKNNLPDETSFAAARKIIDFASSLSSNDILFVLISGGGSALFPYPRSPLTLEDKLYTIRSLSNAGCTIQELNCVRRNISAVKGGNFLRHTKATVIALILSDIIGSPLDLIASGPTVPVSNVEMDEKNCFEIIKRYKLDDALASKVVECIQQNRSVEQHNLPPYHNLIIGSNEIAVNAAADSGRSLGYEVHILSCSLSGIAVQVGEALIYLIAELSRPSDQNLDLKAIEDALAHCSGLNLDTVQRVRSDILKNGEISRKLMFIASGETTVQVVGTGIGGRNQEMVLKASCVLHTAQKRYPWLRNTVFLSAGTDGQDGPSEATGAIVTANDNLKLSMDYLSNNDSFNFFKKFMPQALIITGSTGTNVMDLQIIIVDT